MHHFCFSAAARLASEFKEAKGGGAALAASEIVVEEVQEEEEEEGPSVPTTWEKMAAANAEVTIALSMKRCSRLHITLYVFFRFHI